MSPASLAWKGLVRQPVRTTLVVTGIAILAALLLDMLLLSRGLVVSLEQILNDSGFDIRVSATSAGPGPGPKVERVTALRRDLESLPEVAAAIPIRLGNATIDIDEAAPSSPVELLGIGAGDVRGLWTVLRGSASTEGSDEVVVNQDLGVEPGDRIFLRGRCSAGYERLPPVARVVTAVVAFRFESRRLAFVATNLDGFRELCPDAPEDEAAFLLVASSPDVDTETAVSAVRAIRPDVYTYSNRSLVARYEAADFSYFRQISFVLTVLTLFFTFLLVTVTLTVSVNQRLGEAAALRALGMPRERVVACLLYESGLVVAAGAVGGIVLGFALARGLDGILRSMPGLLENLHFFVFQPRALALYAGLLALSGVAAAAYPVWVVSRLPISDTLRREAL